MPHIGIIGTAPSLNHKVYEIIIKNGFEILFYNPSPSAHINFGKIVTNPFYLIKNCDLIIISHDEDSYFGFIVESILTFKSVLLDNFFSLTCEKVDELIKLSSEASVKVTPLVDGKLLSIIRGVHYFFPHTIRLAQMIIKGQTKFLPTGMNLLSFLLFFKLLFKTNIQRILYEPFLRENLNHLINNHITLSTGVASFYYDTTSPFSLFILDIVSNCQKGYFDFLNEEIWLVTDEDRQKHKLYLESSYELLSQQIFHAMQQASALHDFDLWDIKELLKFNLPFNQIQSLCI